MEKKCCICLQRCGKSSRRTDHPTVQPLRGILSHLTLTNISRHVICTSCLQLLCRFHADMTCLKKLPGVRNHIISLDDYGTQALGEKEKNSSVTAQMPSSCSVVYHKRTKLATRRWRKRLPRYVDARPKLQAHAVDLQQSSVHQVSSYQKVQESCSLSSGKEQKHLQVCTSIICSRKTWLLKPFTIFYTFWIDLIWWSGLQKAVSSCQVKSENMSWGARFSGYIIWSYEAVVYHAYQSV